MPATAQDTKTIYARLLRRALKHWPVFLLSVSALTIYSATNTGFLAVIKMVTDQGFVHKDPSKLSMLPWMMFGLLTIRAFANFTANFSMRWLARRVVEALRLDAFEHLMSMPVSFFDANSVGVLTAKLTYDTEQVANASTRVFVSIIRDSLTIVGMVGYMLYLDWRLTSVFLFMLPVMAIYMRKRTPLVRAAGKEGQTTMGGMTQAIEEAISGQRVVKIFGGAAYENERFAKVVALNRRTMIRLSRMSGSNSMVVELIAAVTLSAVVYYTVGKFSAGEFAAFISAVMMLIAPIKSITGLNEDIQMGMAGAHSVFELIDRVPEADVGNRPITRSQGQISFKQVTLRYDNAQRDALYDINIDIRAGEKVALVGKSGGGKSSLVNLLPRFYALQQGEILLDGINIRDFALADLRAQFALVSQEVVLFNDNIRNNIAYGALRGVSDEEVIKAAEAAYAWEFIQQLPNGLYSEIGDRGVRLSGGQRQRLAIARAILKDAPILLLDEATSALDTESEKHVQAALDRLMQNRTTLIIAHRLSTIENADRILVMEQGSIVEQGSHNELLAQEGIYTSLYRRQFQQ
ncbi:MAG: lipid A export permease/ATP-binding protein MsbA [Methylophilales bacterium]|nr:lipid A export permease/ATP-binding protein MsbA [Methylophilales bacterium]